MGLVSTPSSGGGGGNIDGPASATDNAIARFDGTTGELLQNSGVTISDTNDITGYDATNDGNPEWRLGASDAEELHVQAFYDVGAQTLDYVLFTTDAVSATADKGMYRFNVDGTAILDIDDGGINLAASRGISIAGTDILTDVAGTATLSNIDALDAATEATIEAAIDTLANLTSVQGQTLTLAGAFITSGANSLTLTTTGATNVTLPTTGTLITVDSTNTLTNKTIDADGTGNSITNIENADIKAAAGIVASKIAAGTFAAGTYSFAGSTISDLGIVTTVDINGGTIDGVTIGGASAGAGTFTALVGTSLDLNGALDLDVAALGATITNTADAASSQVAIFEGDRATMADNDEAYITFRLSNDGGAQTEFARLTWVATDVNAGTSVDGRLDFAVVTAGTLADELQLDGAALAPSANDGLTLGTTALGFADINLATGATINVANGNAVITHSADIFTVSTGDLRVTTAGTNTASAVTVGGTQTLTNKTLTSPTIGTSPTAAGATWTDLGSVTTCDINGGTINGITDLAVADGGTGLSSATAYAVLCGGTTSTAAFQSIAGVGTSGQILTSNGAGALPTFQAAAGGTPTTMSVTSHETAARFTDTLIGTSGSVTYGTSGALVTSGSTSDSGETHNLRFGNAVRRNLYLGSPIVSFFVGASLVTSGNGSAFFGIGIPTVAGSGHTFTVIHAGFKIAKAGSTTELFATQANGTTENASAALITTIVNLSQLDLIFEINGTTSIDYYTRHDGGALSAATNLTANMPTGDQDVIQHSVSNNSTAFSTAFYMISTSYSR